MNDPSEIEIVTRDYWLKIVDFLQQNWALIDEDAIGGINVFFLSDTSGVFDRMTFGSRLEAETALNRNGFGRYSEDKDSQTLISAPKPPFYVRAHPNGPIYSSGRFWK